MNLSCETQYNQKAMTAMSKALRKTVRKKNSLCTHILGWTVVVFSLFLSCWTPETGFFFLLTKRSLITLTIAAVLLVFLIWEDSINGYFARKKLAPGTETVNLFPAPKQTQIPLPTAGSTRLRKPRIILCSFTMSATRRSMTKSIFPESP